MNERTTTERNVSTYPTMKNEWTNNERHAFTWGSCRNGWTLESLIKRKEYIWAPSLALGLGGGISTGYLIHYLCLLGRKNKRKKEVTTCLYMIHTVGEVDSLNQDRLRGDIQRHPRYQRTDGRINGLSPLTQRDRTTVLLIALLPLTIRNTVNT